MRYALATLPITFILIAAAPPPPAVLVQTIAVKDVAPADTFVGQVQAIQSVTVVARVQAYLDKIDFKEGGTVAPGQLLFELQKAPYEAAVLQAQGALSRAQAMESNAQMNLDRDNGAGPLAITRQQIQQDSAARDEAAGQLASAKGALQAAELNLSYCTIHSPIAGRIGRAQVTEGNLVGPTTGALATIVQTNPVRVFFNVPDDELLTMEQQAGETPEQFVKAQELTLTLPDGKAYARKGKIEFLNNQVETATGTLIVWGRFDNAEGKLIPGSYVTVTMRAAKPEPRPLVAVQAVQNDAQGQFVLVVDAMNKVRQQRVSLGRQVAQMYIVDRGLTGGERVITEGVQKVHPGEVVEASAMPPAVTDEAGGTAPNGG